MTASWFIRSSDPPLTAHQRKLLQAALEGELRFVTDYAGTIERAVEVCGETGVLFGSGWQDVVALIRSGYLEGHECRANIRITRKGHRYLYPQGDY